MRPGPVTRQDVLALLARYQDRAPADVDEHLGSLELTWLLAQLEEEYEVALDTGDDRFEAVHTVDDAVRAIGSVLGGGGGAMTTVLVTGLAVRSAAGEGLPALHEATVAARPLFRPVDRFAGPSPAAALDGSPGLGAVLAEVVAEARGLAGCPAGAPLLLALHADERTAAVADAAGPGARVYTGACVAASTAVADAAAAIAAGRLDRAVVAAGYLVERDTYGLFAAGHALARDGAVRPFSRGRTGLLLGDAVVAVVLESAAAASGRGARALARLSGWGRAGDAHHVCRPVPDGGGLARAARAALTRAGLTPAAVGYVNANGTGSALGDASEANALRELFGDAGAGGEDSESGEDGAQQADAGHRPPVGATKSVHGHALEASALLELAVTIAALQGPTDTAAALPATAGWLGTDCGVRPLLAGDAPPAAPPVHALTLNAAFGGANTALVVTAA